MDTENRTFANSLDHLPVTVFALSVLMLLAASAVAVAKPWGLLVAIAIFCASMQLTAMWAVHGPGSYLKNCWWSLVSTFVIGLGALIGCGLGTAGEMITLLDSLKLMAFGPVIWCIAQLPYWVVRLTLDWRIQSQTTAATENVRIQDIMMFTVFMALSMAVLQFGHSPGDNYEGVQPDVIFWRFLVPITVISLISFAGVCLPAIVLLFSPDYSRIHLRKYCLIQAALVTIQMFAMIPVEPVTGLWFAIAFTGFTGCVTIVVTIHRRNGLFLCRCGLRNGNTALIDAIDVRKSWKSGPEF